MTHLLDTNICSAFLKRPGGLAHRMLQHGGGLAVPTIVLAELFTWAHRRADPSVLLRLIEDDFLRDVAVLDFDLSAARRFGQLRSELLVRGISVNPVDLMIAAVALANDLTLVTHNTRHFEPIPGLRVVDWLES
jgi:tRNA(fMet)-specific endonuclease VapC